MTKILLIIGFVLAVGTLGFAAANAGAPTREAGSVSVAAELA